MVRGDSGRRRHLDIAEGRVAQGAPDNGRVGITDKDWFAFLFRQPGIDELTFRQPGGNAKVCGTG